MGIDQNRFESKINDEFICPICLDVLLDPIYLPSCEHVFCNECINDWLSKNKNQQCPMDRKQLDPKKFRQPLRSFCNLLNKLKLRCQYCDIIIILSDVEKHENYCFQNPNNFNKELICPDCGYKIKIDEKNRHNCVEYLKSILIESKNLNEMIDKKNDEIVELKKSITSLQSEKFFLEKLVEQLQKEIESINIKNKCNITNTNQDKQQQENTITSPCRKAPAIPPKPQNYFFPATPEESVNNDKNNKSNFLIDLEPFNDNDQSDILRSSSIDSPQSKRLPQLIYYHSFPSPSSSSSLSSVLSVTRIKQFFNQKMTIIEPITNYIQMNNYSKNSNVHQALSTVDRRHFYGDNVTIDRSISLYKLYNDINSSDNNNNYASINRKNSHAFPLKYEIRLLEYIEPFLNKKSRVLDIGSGMGHLACCLANLSQFVIGIDIVKEFVRKSQEIVEKYYQNLNICFCKLDGRLGCDAYSPYDLILIEPIIRNGSGIPEKLFQQLNVNGSIVVVLRVNNEFLKKFPLQLTRIQHEIIMLNLNTWEPSQSTNNNRFHLLRFIKLTNGNIDIEVLCNDHDWILQNNRDYFK